MKILYIITKASWGGAQKYVHDLAVFFNERAGVKAEVAYGQDGKLSEELSAKGIHSYQVEGMQRDIAILGDIKAFISLLRIISQSSPDVVHLNSSKAAGLGALAARCMGVKNIVTTIHGAPFREDRNIVSRSLIYILTWATCLLSHKVICVSKKDEIDISRMMFIKSKTKTVYLGIDYGELKKRKSEKTHHIKLVSVGELHRNKGYGHAILAVKELHKELGRVSYSIYGEGEDRERLTQMIHMHGLEDIVTLYGYDKEASEKILEYDIYLLPSVKEGLPWVLIEAGKVQLPVIASITGGVPEIIKHEQTGLLVRSKDHSSIRDAVMRLDSDRRYARKLGEKLREHLVATFSRSRMFTETALVYGLYEKK